MLGHRLSRGLCGLLLTLLLGSVAWPSVGVAQLHRATDPVMLPASAYVLQDDAFAAEVNPALVGLLPAFSAAYVHAEVDARDSWLGRGDALHLATPLFLGFSGSLSLHSVRPGGRALRPLGTRAERSMAVLSLAFAPSQRFSIGLSGRAVSSSNPLLDGLGSMDIGVALRPSSLFGLTLSARDLFISREGFGTAGLRTGTTFLAGLQLRPLGTSTLILDGSLAMDTSREVATRVGASLRIPRIGAVTAMAELEPVSGSGADLRGMLEFVASYGHGSLGFGAVSGDGFDSSLDYYAYGRIDGYPRTDRVRSAVILDLEVSSTNPRALLSLVHKLMRARRDRRVAGVLLRPRESGMGPADAQELRLLLAELREAGKLTACHLEDASETEYYACAGSDEVIIDPAGSIRLQGTSATTLVFGDALRKLHVRAEFLRIGEHKSAPEQFTASELSQAARAQARRLLSDVHERKLVDLAKDRHSSPDQVADAMDHGPYLAGAALERGLADVAVDTYELSRTGSPKLAGHPFVHELSPLQPTRFGVGPRVGVVVIDDTIVDGESTDVPLLGLHASGAKTVIKALEGLAADPTVRAIVLRVDSPGGAVLAADQIWRAVRRARARKPVIASLGRVAASGGYYVASAADEIWADPSTLTGSIGIFYGKVDVSGLAEELGIGVELIRRGRRATGESPFTSFTADERAALADSLRHYYRLFLGRVAEGRRMSLAQVDELGRGRVFSGDAARAVGLVDRLGGYGSALARAKELAGLAGEVEVLITPEADAGLLDLLLSGARADAAPGLSLPQGLRRWMFSMLSLSAAGRATPLALLPSELSL